MNLMGQTGQLGRIYPGVINQLVAFHRGLESVKFGELEDWKIGCLEVWRIRWLTS